MRRKYSKAMYERVKHLTNGIFKDSICKVTGLNEENENDLLTAIDFIRYMRSYSSVYDEQEIQEMKKTKERVDNLYLETILSLNNQQLEEIMTVHHEGKIKRSTRTVEAIISELTRRSVLDDTNESDNRYTNGEVHGHTKKSKRGCKKVAIKRHKSTKN